MPPPRAKSRSTPRRRAARGAARAAPSPTRAGSQLLRKIARRRARFLGALIRGFLPAQHADELIEHGDEEDRDAKRQRELWDPDRHADQPLRHFLELPAV